MERKALTAKLHFSLAFDDERISTNYATTMPLLLLPQALGRERPPHSLLLVVIQNEAVSASQHCEAAGHSAAS